MKLKKSFKIVFIIKTQFKHIQLHHKLSLSLYYVLGTLLNVGWHKQTPLFITKFHFTMLFETRAYIQKSKQALRILLNTCFLG